MNVIADKPVRDGSLWRGGLQSGMAVDHAHRRVKAGIRDAKHAYFAVIVRHVFHQPVDGVPGVGAFVKILGAFVRIERTHMHVSALGTVTPAHILRDHDELVLCQRAER